MSLPQKKKLIAIDPTTNPALLPGNPVHFRKIQEADISIILDEAGIFLQKEMHLKEGGIPKEKHTIILNSMVSFYFRKLSQIISKLSPEHLLDFLVTYYEAIVSERVYRQVTISTQLACFSSIQELTQQLVDQLPKIDEAAIACRFLIEYVVSQPPKGNMPISLVVYDQIMALASEIISRGNQSDFDRYGLFDFDFTFLASGRLGFNRKQYNAKVNSFQNSRSKVEIEEAGDNFTRWWKENLPITPNEYPEHVKELNKAFEAEFGIVFTDITSFISGMGDLSLELGKAQLKSLEIKQLVSKMQSILHWSSEKIILVIDFLSLFPRKNFLDPPKPYNKSDIYPWRMGRGLSFIRRPLLKVYQGDQTIICWAVRSLFTSFDYLMQATVSGRLQNNYRSNEMREFLGRIRVKEGEQFNNKVFDAIYKLSGVIVDKKVKKIDGTRIGSPGNDLGDLDVISFFPKTKVLAVIECKDLEVGRNAVEMSRELEGLFIGNEHRDSTITKHLRRVKWVTSNLHLFFKSYGIKDYTKWKVEPLLVISSEMVTPHFYNSPIPVFSFSLFVSDYLRRHG